MMKIESKEKLAKLLATEDLDIQRQQVDTAYFDIVNRSLILPIWKDMPNYLYDLLVGHEVGHALFTPTNIERVKKAYKKSSKHCVNIIEDARIEKLIKNRYPGLRKQFFAGYKHLTQKDFFGTSKKPVKNMNILDRLNLYFKIKSFVNVPFNDVEMDFVNRIEKLRNFKEVEEIAEEIYAYAKENKTEDDVLGESEWGENTTPSPSDEEIDGDDFNSDDEPEEFDSDEENEASDSAETDEDGKTASTNEKDKGESGDEEIDAEDDSFEKYDNDEDILDKASRVDPEDVPEKLRDEVQSTTYEHFQQRLDSLIKKDRKNIYLTVPDSINWDVGVHDYKRVHKNIDDFYANPNKDIGYMHMEASQFARLKDSIYEGAKFTLNKWKKESLKTVNHIAMEFERKKAATVYKKRSMSKTGVLDTNKLFSAKYNDDVFKKNMRLPEGKSHGLVMIIDWSGSMSANIFGCIKQVMELTFFCKKVNIPFEVYSFTEMDPSDTDKRYTFNYKHGDMVTDPRVCLRNYISSRMNLSEYNKALINLCIIANRNKPYAMQGYPHAGYPIPKEDELRCTPLNGAILLSEHVIREFKKKNNLECVHSVWLTDGEASGQLSQYDIVNNPPDNPRKFSRENFYKEKTNIYIKDTKKKKNHLVFQGGMHGRGRATTPAMFDIVKDRLGINIVGFFILSSFSSNSLWRYVPEYSCPDYNEKRAYYDKWIKQARKDGWFVNTQGGYDEYYVIRGDNIGKDLSDNLDINPYMTQRKIVSTFMKKNNAFKVNRIILSRFIDLITENTEV